MKYLGNIDKERYMFINAIYNKKTDVDDDVLYVIYKDKYTDEKLLYTEKKPKYTYYVAKEEFRNYDYHMHQFPIKNLDEITCEYRSLPFSVADNCGDSSLKSLFKSSIQQGQYKVFRKIHSMANYVFGSDIPIETYAKIQYILNYRSNTDVYNVSRIFLDIEVDGIHVKGFPQSGECPINAVTIIDEPSKTCYTFLLRNEDNPLIEEFEKNITPFKQDLHDSFDEIYGHLEYKIFMYDREIDLIKDMFSLIHTLKRDFCLIWNMSFDIPFIIERIKNLGYEPEDIMCHPDFETKLVYYKPTSSRVIENKTDRVICNSYTTYLDQCTIYAGLRKGQGTIGSKKLNDVGRTEVHDEKIDYHEVADFKNFPYQDYTKFVKYNIKDVLLQFGIDKVTSDLDELYIRAFLSATPYELAFKQLTFLKNRAYVSYYKQGLIICNTEEYDEVAQRNILYEIYGDGKEEDEDEETQFPGALVADPLNNSNTGIELFGKQSKYIYDDSIDEDFSSMYPNVNITFSISATSLIGKLHLNVPIDNVKRFYNISIKDIEQWDAGREFIEDYLTEHYTILGNIYFNLPTGDELINKFKGELE